MSTYVISDLHGCKKEFDEMLKLIEFNDYDQMYVIGDICDRGKEPIPLLVEIMSMPNVHVIMGNHDIWLLRHIQTFINAKTDMTYFVSNDDMNIWINHNGGFVTADQLLDLPTPICYDIKMYLENLPFYQQLSVNGTKYLLVHAGINSKLHPHDHISAIPKDELVWTHIGIDDNPYDDVVMIVGHIPTLFYGDEYDGKIAYGKDKKIIHIDCGCVYGRKLGCLRLDDGKEFYVDSSYPYLKA